MQLTTFILSCFILLSIGETTAIPVSNDPLPKVFLLGEYETKYEKLKNTHKEQLLSICSNDMKGAFKKWISMLQEMEAYGEQVEYDLKGVKFWLHVFWNEDGSISNIAYHLRPNSRHLDTNELTIFLTNFINYYRLPLTTQTKYSHYSSAYFPLAFQRVVKN